MKHLKVFLEDPQFRWVVVQAMDPRITFGISSITIKKIIGTAERTKSLAHWQKEDCPVEVSTMLHSMADRSLAGASAIKQLKLLYHYLDPRSWNVLCRILTKRLDCGADKIINEVRPGTVWSFHCMLATPYEVKRIKGYPIAAEPKLDGWRSLVVVRNGIVENNQIVSREGLPFPAFDHLIPEVELIAKNSGTLNFVLDGEVTSGSINETASAAGKKSELALDAVFNAFDLIPLEEWDAPEITDAYRLPYNKRRENLLNLFTIKDQSIYLNKRFIIVPMTICNSEEDISAHFIEQRSKGLEGSIVKMLDHTYERKQSFSWLKLKPSVTYDLPIIGFEEGEGKYTGMLGAFLCDFNGVRVKVGGGIEDEERKHIWMYQDNYIGKIIEVEAHEVTPDGSLRHTRKKRWRYDKASQPQI